MSDYLIRPAVQADLPAIVSIYNSTVAARSSTADLHPVSVADRQAWFDAHGGSRPLLVMQDADGALLAWGSFSDYYPRQAYHITAEASIYVHPDRRGGGLGKILLADMLQRAPALGIRNIIAVIFGHNTASLRLFAGFGFQQWGLLPAVCDLDGRAADIVLLGLTLPAAEFHQAV